jgi:glucose-1-phosphate thymidylyltransferase
MIGIILAGGYAKRLWPLTLNKPKPLLKVNGRPIIDYALASILSSDLDLTKVIVLTNSRFQRQLQAWAEERKLQNVTVVSDGSSSEEQKPGAVGALALLSSEIRDDFLVVAGDCIYPNGLKGLLRYFREKNSSVVGLYRAREIDQVRRGSAVELGTDNIIVSFLEKPTNTTTTLSGAVIYAFPEEIKNRLLEYVDLGLPRDEPGRFIEWLYKKETVRGYLLDGVVYDIGTLEAYEEVSAT